MRQGELYALTIKDIDFDNRIISISKSLSVLSNGEIIINKPKTEQSERTIEVPQFLIDDIREFISRNAELPQKNDRIFNTTKSNL